MEEKEQYKHYAKKFGIPVEDIIWYNHGICYDRIIVKTLTSAEAIGKKVNGADFTQQNKQLFKKRIAKRIVSADLKQ